MKTTIEISMLLIVFLVMNCSKTEEVQTDCSSDEDTIIIETFSLGNLGYGKDTLACENDCGNAIDYKGKQFIIQSDNDYNELIVYSECLLISSWPQVDFNKYTLLAGVAITGSICKIITEHSVMKICKENKIVYYVKIEGGGLAALGAVFYWVLIPKISSEQKIEFEIVME